MFVNLSFTPFSHVNSQLVGHLELQVSEPLSIVPDGSAKRGFEYSVVARTGRYFLKVITLLILCWIEQHVARLKLKVCVRCGFDHCSSASMREHIQSSRNASKASQPTVQQWSLSFYLEIGRY